MISDTEHLFMCLWAIYMSSLEKSIHVLCPFLNWIICHFSVFSRMSSLHILDFNNLLDISFANIFSHSVVAFLFC